MIRMKSILMVVSCSALLFAAGTGSDTGSNGDMGGKTKISGTIEEVMRQDSMLVIRLENDKMLDTVRINDKTKMDTNLDQLKKGDRVEVEYMTKDNMKVAESVKMDTSDGGDGSQDKSHKKDTSKSDRDTMQY